MPQTTGRADGSDLYSIAFATDLGWDSILPADLSRLMSGKCKYKCAAAAGKEAVKLEEVTWRAVP